MKDDSATADPSATDKDSAIPPVEEQDPEGHPEEPTEQGEETPAPNEEAPEDPAGAPEDESEEDLDPLEKAKKHADRKIAELGEKASSGEKKLIAAVMKTPELLIEMFDPSSELYDRKLAEKISQEKPDVYARADAIYKAKRAGTVPPPNVVTPQAQPAVTDALIKQKIDEALAEREKVLSERAGLQEFKDSTGLTAEQFEVIEPNLRAIAASLREADETLDLKDSMKRAFMAMFPGDYEKSVRQKAFLDVAKKKAMISPAGSGESPLGDKKLRKLSPEEEAGWKASNLPLERYITLQDKYFRK